VKPPGAGAGGAGGLAGDEAEGLAVERAAMLARGVEHAQHQPLAGVVDHRVRQARLARAHPAGDAQRLQRLFGD
jgi:hypothetical protein